jgi:nucleoside-diphosphate-sugar epimerase
VKVLQIGVTGQVGYALTRALAAAGHDITVLVRDAARLPFPEGVRVVAEPEFTSAVFAQVLGDVECAIYGVGLPEQFAIDIDVFDRVNRRLLGTFLAALDAAGLRRLVYISTYEVFRPRDGVIRESHPVAAPENQSPYFAAMTRAYQDTQAFAKGTGTRLTTIHPAAVYGGLDTGDGFTAVIENMLRWRLWRLPVVVPGRFPLVHADSLAAGVLAALDQEGPFIISDALCDLSTLARTLRRQARSFVPPRVPVRCAYATTTVLEALARVSRRAPIMSRVQLDFITAGSEPLPERAAQTLGFTPLPIDEGLRCYLADRAELIAARGVRPRKRLT